MRNADINTRRKSSDSGSALIYVLFLALLMGLAAAAILTGAFNAGRRAAFTEAFERRYYTAESAARMATKLIEKNLVNLKSDSDISAFFDEYIKNAVIDSVSQINDGADKVTSLEVESAFTNSKLVLVVTATAGDAKSPPRTVELMREYALDSPGITILSQSIREK